MEAVKRHRLSIPTSDTTTLDWLKAQQSMSTSIRHLIREYVSKCGYTDPTCLRIERPEPKAKKQEIPEVVHPRFETPERSDAGSGYVDPLELLGM